MNNSCKLAARLCRAQLDHEDLQTRSGAEGGRNVNYRRDLGAHWSLWSRRLLLMDRSPPVFILFSLESSTSSSPQPLQLSEGASFLPLQATAFVPLQEGAWVRSVLPSSNICLCRLIRQVWQQRLKEERVAAPERPTEQVIKPRNLRSIAAHVIDLLYIFLHISPWLRIKIKQICEWELLPVSLSRRLKSIWILHIFKAGNRRCPPPHPPPPHLSKWDNTLFGHICGDRI